MESFLGFLLGTLIGVPFGILISGAFTYFIVKRKIIDKVEKTILDRLSADPAEAYKLAGVFKDAVKKVTK